MAKVLSRKVSIYINGKEVENTIKSLRDEMSKLVDKQKTLTIGSEEYVETSLKIKEINSVLKEQKAAVMGLDAAWDETRRKAAEWSNIIVGLKTLWQKGSDLYGWVNGLSDEAARMDDVYADVQKTTGLTREEVEKLNEAFKKMDTRTSREQLNQLAYEAGKLGISSAEQVAHFVSASDKINIALGDVLGEGAMVTIGKLTEIFESSTTALEGKNLEEKMLAIGSAVNSLGQASTANEGYMVEFMKRLGGIASQAGLSADQILGYASALDQNGQAVEMSATAFTKMIMQMVKKPEEFVRAAGTSVEEFKRMMDEDMNGAILRVLEGMDRQGGFQEIVKMFNEMGLDGSRAAQSISSLAKHLDQVREAQALASDEIATGASVMNEFNTKNNTMQAQAEKAKKAFEDVRIELGNELYPIVVHMTKAGTGVTKVAASIVRLLKDNHVVLAGVVALGARYVALQIRARISIENLVSRVKRLLGIEQLEEMQKARANAKQLKKIAANEKERLAEMKLELEKNKKIATMKVEMYDYDGLTKKILAQERVRELETAVTKQATVATNAHTAATKAQKAAFSSTPWGLVITALTSIVALTWQAVKSSSQWKLHETMKKIAGETAQATQKINYLFTSLRTASEGSEKYKMALAELKQEYPDLIKNFITEEGKLKDIEKAYKALTKAAKESIYERIKAESLGDAAANAGRVMFDRTNKIRETIMRAAKKAGKESIGEIIFKETEQEIAKIETGEAKWEEIYERLNKKLYDNNIGVGEAQGGKKVMRYLYLDRDLKAISDAYAEYSQMEEAFLDKDEEKDPFNVQSMNLKQLNEQLATSQRLLKSYQKAADEGRQGFSEKAENERQKIEAINAQITKLRNDTQSTSAEFSSGKETPEQKRARKAQEAWERFSESYQRLMEKLDAKTQTGLARTFADVDVSIKKMEDDLNAAAAKHPEANQWLADLKAKAEEWKQAEMEKYIAKANKELAKFVKTGEKSDIEAVNKLTNEFERLQSEIAQADEKIKQYEADLQNPDVPEAVKKQLAGIIEKYRETISKTRTDLIKTVSAEMPDISSFLASDSGPENKEKRLKALNEEYEKNVRLIEEAWERNNGLLEVLQTQIALERDKNEVDKDPAVIDALDKQVEAVNAQNAELEKQKKALDEVNEKKKKAIDTDEWVKSLQKVTESIRTFADASIEALQHINDILDNQSNQRIKDANDEKEDKIKILDEQLKNNLISQEEYEARKQQIEDEYDEYRKQEEREQFRRQKAMALAQASMSAALAVIQVWADSTLATWAKIAMSAVAATNVALQTKAILNEPEPYAKGGYVPRDTVFRAGEAGEEWVASNQLLTDPTTAPVIDALEQYQHGDRSVLARLPFARVNTANATTAAATIDRKLSATRTMAEGGNRMEALLQDLCRYMKDPNNRRAVISRDYQNTYERNENFLRSVAKLG